MSEHILFHTVVSNRRPFDRGHFPTCISAAWAMICPKYALDACILIHCDSRGQLIWELGSGLFDNLD